jgi:hypothetical protein
MAYLKATLASLAVSFLVLVAILAWESVKATNLKRVHHPGELVATAGTYSMALHSPLVQICAAGPPPPEGRINCTTLDNYINNTRLDFGYWCASSGRNGRRHSYSSSRKLLFGGTELGSNCIGPCSAECENESAVAVESPNRFVT